MDDRLDSTFKFCIAFIAVMVLLAILIWADNSRQNSMNEQVQEVARCRSLDGEYADGKCFVNREEK